MPGLNGLCSCFPVVVHLPQLLEHLKSQILRLVSIATRMVEGGGTTAGSLG